MFLLILLTFFVKYGVSYNRPDLVKNALSNGGTINYVGIGSNMLRSKVENRGLNNTKIEINSMRPGFIKDHRLAFNLRGFPPIEPAMAGIEPHKGSECHGAVIELNAEEYEKLWRSEGGGSNRPGYEEVVVDAFVYGKEHQPLQAVALRAAPHARLSRDCEPSERYLQILLDGAAALPLREEYIMQLHQIPTARPSTFIKWLSRKNLILFAQLFKRGLRKIIKPLISALYAVYVPSNANIIARSLNEMLTCLILLPGAIVGLLIQRIGPLFGMHINDVNMFQKSKTASSKE